MRGGIHSIHTMLYMQYNIHYDMGRRDRMVVGLTAICAISVYHH